MCLILGAKTVMDNVRDFIFSCQNSKAHPLYSDTVFAKYFYNYLDLF